MDIGGAETDATEWPGVSWNAKERNRRTSLPVDFRLVAKNLLRHFGELDEAREVYMSLGGDDFVFKRCLTWTRTGRGRGSVGKCQGVVGGRERMWR